MFASAVVVGLYHKSDNTIDINPDETKVFAADDQVVALSTSGDSSCHAIRAAVQRVCTVAAAPHNHEFGGDPLHSCLAKWRRPRSPVACVIL